MTCDSPVREAGEYLVFGCVPQLTERSLSTLGTFTSDDANFPRFDHAACVTFGKLPALISMPGTVRPSWSCSHLPVSMIPSRDTPVWIPERCSMYSRSSVGMLPVAAGANGQPPTPPTLESRTATPAWTAAYALAMPVLRVLWKWQRNGMPGTASRTR